MPTYKSKARSFRKKSYRKYKKSSSWNRWFQKGVTPKEAIDYAVSGVQYLKGLVNSEMFKKDTTLSLTAISPTCTNVTNIAQGDGSDARTGNSIFVRSWNFKGCLRNNASGASSVAVRISLVIDNQQLADTDPSYTNVYEANSPYSHLNSDTVGRFKVLYSRVFIVNNSDKLQTLFNINVPMRHHVRYNGTASTDIQKGGLFLCLASDEPGANLPTISGEYRLSYHDN